jgi:hypothetical protein
MHPEERQLRPVRANRAPLRHAITRAQGRPFERRCSCSKRVRLLRVQAERSRRNLAGEQPVEPRVVGVRERRARDEHGARSVDDLVDGTPHGGVVPVSLEVGASEGKPPRRDAEAGTRDAILLPAGTSRLAFGREAGASIPPSRRRVRARIEREHGQQLDSAPFPGPARHRRAEREDTVVGVRRHHHDPGYRGHDGL